MAVGSFTSVCGILSFGMESYSFLVVFGGLSELVFSVSVCLVVVLLCLDETD